MVDGLARILRELDLDWDVISPILKLIKTGSYEQTFAQLQKSKRFGDEKWEKSAQVSLLVVTWRPETAHEWLQLVVARLCSEECGAGQGLYHGSFLGLLEAGVRLDEEPGQTKFQTMLLGGLVELVCNGKPQTSNMPHDDRNIDYPNLQRRMTKALPRFLFPETLAETLTSEAELNLGPPKLPAQEMKQQRTDQTKQAVQYLHQHLGTGKPTWFQKLFIEQLTQVLLAKTTPAEKVSALQHLLWMELYSTQ